MIKIPKEKIVEEIKKRDARRVLLQAPDGMKTLLGKSLPFIESETNSSLLLQADSCFGSCDLICGDTSSTGSDLIIHLGHTPLSVGDEKDKIMFIDVYDDARFKDSALSHILEVTGDKNVGLGASTQYLFLLRQMRQMLEENNRNIFLGTSDLKTLQPGQILGCDVSALKNISPLVDEFIVIGGGIFHGLGAALWTGKKTWIADPYRDKLMDVTNHAKKKLKILAGKIDEARRADSFGVIIGLKEGQTDERLFSQTLEKLKRMDKRVIKLAIREITPERLRYFDWVECFIQTMCPRLSIDDVESYRKPLLSYDQLLISMDESRFEEIYPS